MDLSYSENINEKLNRVTKLSEDIRRRNRVSEIQEYLERTEELLGEMETSILNIMDAPPAYRHAVLLPRLRAIKRLFCVYLLQLTRKVREYLLRKKYNASPLAR